MAGVNEGNFLVFFNWIKGTIYIFCFGTPNTYQILNPPCVSISSVAVIKCNGKFLLVCKPTAIFSILEAVASKKAILLQILISIFSGRYCCMSLIFIIINNF